MAMTNLLESAYVMRHLTAFVRNFAGFRVAYTNEIKFSLALTQHDITVHLFANVATNRIVKEMFNKCNLNSLA